MQSASWGPYGLSPACLVPVDPGQFVSLYADTLGASKHSVDASMLPDPPAPEVDAFNITLYNSLKEYRGTLVWIISH